MIHYHNRETHAPFSEVIEAGLLPAKVLRILIVAPAKVRNVPYAVTSGVRNFPRMAEPDGKPWRNIADKKHEDDTSSYEAEAAPEVKFDALQETLAHIRLHGHQS